jgi:2-oxoglutarate ferredoxin oxidoreductase subunit delta
MENDVTNEPKPLNRVIIEINQAWCKGCTICVAFCPKAVYTADKRGHPVISDSGKCIACMLCVERCPDFAITITSSNIEKAEKSAS